MLSVLMSVAVVVVVLLLLLLPLVQLIAYWCVYSCKHTATADERLHHHHHYETVKGAEF